MPAAGVPLSIPVALLNTNPFGKAPASVSAAVGEPDAVTVNSPAEPTVNVELFALVICGAAWTAVSKNNPLATALGPERSVILIVTLPETFHTR